MHTLRRQQIASVLASLVDFLVTFILVQGIGVWYLAGSATGTLSGGITHFL